PPFFPGGPALVSSDGLQWQSFETNYLGYSLHFFNGRFISSDGTNIVTSTDGVTWKKAARLGSIGNSISDDGARVYLWGGSTSFWFDGDFARAVPFKTAWGMRGGAFGRGTLLIRNGGVYRFDGRTNPWILSPDVGEGDSMPGLAFGDGNFVVSSTRGFIISR